MTRRSLDRTHSRDLLDRHVALCNLYARREIDRLRSQMEANAREGRLLWVKYHLTGIPHEIEDFLQSLGE